MTQRAYAAVTPSDTVPLPALATDLWVGVSGDVAIKSTYDSAAVTLHAVPAGRWWRLPHPALFVMATGTTAGDITAALARSTRDGGR